MKRYEITVYDEQHPLSFAADSIAEAYGCIVTLKSWMKSMRYVDLDEVMETLVCMMHDTIVDHCEKVDDIDLWSVSVREDDA